MQAIPQFRKQKYSFLYFSLNILSSSKSFLSLLSSLSPSSAPTVSTLCLSVHFSSSKLQTQMLCIDTWLPLLGTALWGMWSDLHYDSFHPKNQPYCNSDGYNSTTCYKYNFLSCSMSAAIIPVPQRHQELVTFWLLLFGELG